MGEVDRLTQKDFKFQVSLGYMGNTVSNKTKRKTKKLDMVVHPVIPALRQT